MARISVIVPAFNAAPFIAETLQSVCGQSYRDIDIVVIDDGSSDKTADIAKQTHPAIRVISQANAGMSASRNRGIDASDSEYIALLDSDDIWHPDKLKWQIEHLLDNTDHDFAYTEFTVWHGDDPAAFYQLNRNGHADPDHSGWIYHHLILENLALPSSVVFSRKAWQKIGPFTCLDQQTDDWNFLVSASQQFKFIRLAESFVLYRQHLNSLSRKIPAFNKHEAMRASLLAKFGHHSPDGTPVDMERLKQFIYAGRCNFADGHCAAGNMATGLAEFARLLISSPNRATTIEKLGKSLIRRVFPKQAGSQA